MARLIPILLLALAPLSDEEKPDLTVVNRIKSEAFYNSQVMDHLFYLADVYGPRLTSSPGHKAAADWVVKRLQSYGLKNVKLEKWGPFGQSWNLKQFSAHLIEPQYQPLIGFPLAWTPGTGGAVSGEPVMAVLRSEADFEKHKGKLRGKVVLTMEPKVIAPVTEPLSRRWTPDELLLRATTNDPSRGPLFGPPTPAGTPPPPPVDRAAAARLRNKMHQYLKDEGALVVLQYGYNGDGGTGIDSIGCCQR